MEFVLSLQNKVKQHVVHKSVGGFDSIMKQVSALALLFLCTASLSAANIFSETFTASNGTTSGNQWYLDMTGCSVSGADYFHVVSNRLEARDTDCDATFYTYPIDISAYRNVAISIDATESGSLGNSDRIQFLYSINGGPFQHFSNNGDVRNDFSSMTASQSGLNGQLLVIKIIAYNDSGNDYYRVDNIEVTGTEKDNFVLTLNKTDGTCSTPSSIDLTVTPGSASAGGTSPVGTSSGCTVTLSGSGSHTLTSGQVGCITGSFNGSVTINGGTLINAGSASFSSFNFWSGSFYNNGTMTVSNMQFYSGRYFYNYGTVNNTGTFTAGGEFYNYGPLTTGHFTTSSGAKVYNTSDFYCSGNLTNNSATLFNSGTITASGNITNNSGSIIINSGVITGNSLTNNAPINNNGSINVGSYTTINGSGSLAMNSGSSLVTNSITLNGSITQSGGSACANIAVSGNTTINGGGSMSGNVQLCDADGVETNWSSNYSGGASLNCNCSGLGYTYAWSNGATTQDISNLTAGTYTVTVTGPNGTTLTGSATITSTGSVAGDPAVFGSNVWNVYAWNAGNSSGGNGAWSSNYSGYYVINSLNFDTRTGQTYSTAQSWSDGGSPSNAAGYQGCSVGNDNHSYAFKRQGFPCGNYVINLPNHDDRVQLYVDGTLQYDNSGCCARRNNIWSGFLGASSTIELRISEGGGGSHGSIELDLQSSVSIASSTGASRCSNGTVTLQASASAGAVIDWYAAASGGSVLSGGSGTSNYTTPTLSSTTIYYAEARHSATGCVSSARTAVTATIGSNPTLSASATDATGGNSNGAVNLAVSGGNSPYSFAWSNGASTQNLSNLSGGSYTVTVTEANGCTASTTAVVNDICGGMMGFSYMRTITIDHDYVYGNANLTDFPYLIDITDNSLRTVSNGGRLQNSNGYDVMFTTGDGSQVLEIEIEHYSGTSGNLVAWVKIPTLLANANTVIRLYYGKSGVSQNPSSSNTWTSDYRAVYHFNNSIADASTNGNDGTNNGSSNTSSGKIRNGRNFDGDNDYIQVPHSSSLNVTGNTITVSAWARVVDIDEDGPFVVKGGMNEERYMLGVNESPYSYNMRTTTNNGHFRYNVGTVSYNNWQYVVMVYDAGISNPRLRMYIDGELVSSQNAAGSITSTTQDVFIGKRPYGDNRYFEGRLDELRISSVAKSADWIKTEYANQNNPNNTYTLGSESGVSSNINASISATNATCSSTADGAINLTVANGTAPYTFAWSNGQTSEDLAALVPGNYSVTISDFCGTTATANTTVSANGGGGSASISGTNTICTGSSSTFTASGGGTYAWSTGATTAAISVSTAGTYTVTVTNANGCTASASRTLTVNAAATASISGTNTICTGASSTFTASGGSTYAWSTGASTAAISVSTAGAYTVTVTNANGCTATASRTLTVNNLPTVSISGTNSICTGASSTFTASGGSTYAWSTGASTAAISVSTAGAYTVTVTNANGCTASASRTLTVSTPPTVSISGTNINCFGQSTGAATLTVSGGTAPFTYNWGSGVTSQNRTGLTPGSYTVTVTTAAGCTASASVTITQPASALSATTSATPVTCGFCTNGSATVSASGGTSPYTYAWSGGGTSSSITNRATGTYTVTVTDNKGCTVTRSATITLPLQINIAGASACTAGSGSATASGTGGTAPYTFVWSNGATTATITNLTSGTYFVTGTDANGITATQSVVISNVSIAAALSPASATICAGESVQLNASGANTYTWSPSAGLSDPNIANPIATPTSSTTYTLVVGATSGELVTNGNFESGNTGFTSAYGAVSAPGNGNKLHPEGLYAVDTNANNYHGNFFGKGHGGSGRFMIINGATLTGQTIWSQTVNVTPNTNYNFSTWITSVNAASPAQLRFEINGVLLGPVIDAPDTLHTWLPFNTTWNSGSATSAVISIVNENAAAGGNDYGLDDISFTTVCYSNQGSIPITVKARPTAEAGSNVSLCTGASTTLTASGAGTGGTYAWSSGAITASTSVSPASSTVYTVTATNSVGCSSTDSVSVTVNSTPSVSISGTNVNCYGATTGAATTTVTGGSAPYSYNWGGGITTENRTGIPAGSYTVTVTSNGCTASASVTITQPASGLNLSATSAMPSSSGGSDGRVDLSVAGGTAPYSYSWSNGASTQDLSAVTSGNYTVTVTDANNCTATYMATVPANVGPCVCIASGNWSNPSTWSGNCSGGGGKYAGYLDDIELKGFKVVVDSTHTVKSLVLKESTSDTTRLSFTNTNTLDILEDFSITTTATGRNVEIDIDGSAEMTVEGDFKINHGFGLDVIINLNANNGNDAKLTVLGNLDMTLETSARDLLITANAANDTINVYGSVLYKNNSTNSGDDIFITMASSSLLRVGGDVNFNGVRNQNMDLILNNSSKLELGGSIVRKASPSKFGRIVMNSSSTLIFNGSDQQIWEGNTGNTDNNTYRHVIIRNTSNVSPQVLLNGDVTVATRITFEDGNVGTGNDMLIVTSNSANSVTGHSAQSYVVGTLRRYIASNNASYDFPLGYGEPNQYYWARIKNNYMVGPTYLTATFGEIPTNQRNASILVTDNDLTYTELNQAGIWTIDPNTQPLLGSYTIEVGTENFQGLMDNMFRIIKRPSRGSLQAWSNGGGLLSVLGAVDRLVGNGLTTLGGLTSFSDFGIAQGNGSSLPIDLVSFSARPDGERVRLDWTVSMEINNDYFTIERSLDGVDFEPVVEVEGAGNHSEEKKYVAYDDAPYKGLSYYRLRQTDFDGVTKAYDMVSVTITSTASTHFDIVPNPNKGSFTIHMDTPFDKMNVSVLNAMGQMVYYNELLGTTGKTKTPLDLGDILASGIYFVKIDSGTNTYIKQMVIE